jgi:hypothetical protein
LLVPDRKRWRAYYVATSNGAVKDHGDEYQSSRAQLFASKNISE